MTDSDQRKKHHSKGKVGRTMITYTEISGLPYRNSNRGQRHHML